MFRLPPRGCGVVHQVYSHIRSYLARSSDVRTHMPEDACNVDLGMPRSCTPLFGQAVRMKLLRVGGSCCSSLYQLLGIP